MSGDAYTINREEEQRAERQRAEEKAAARNKERRREIANQLASVCAKLLVGAVTMTASVIGMAAYGTAKGVTALARAGVRSYREHKIEAARQKQEEMQMAAQRRGRTYTYHDPGRQAEQAQTQMQKDVRTELLSGSGMLFDDVSREAATAETAESVETLERLIRGTQEQREALSRRHMKKLAASAEQMLAAASGGGSQAQRSLEETGKRCEEIIGTWKEESQRISREHAAQLHRRMEAGSRQMEASYTQMLAQAKAMAADQQELQHRLKELADDAIRDAAYLLRKLTGLGGAAVYAREHIALLTAQLNRSHAAYRSGSYETAYGLAQNLSMEIQSHMCDVLCEQEKEETEREALTIRAAMLAEQMEGIGDVSFVHKGVTYRDDLRRYNKAGFGGCRRRMDELWLMLHEHMSAEERREAGAELSRLEWSFRNICDCAWERMLGAYYTNDMAGDVAAAFLEQGFTIEDQGYEGGTDGGRLHINFVNPVSGEKITVSLDSDGKGNPDASLHQFGDGRSEQPDLARQEQLVGIMEEALHTKMQCSNPGQESVQFEEADIQAQKKKRLETGQ